MAIIQAMWNRAAFRALVDPPVIGVVHLPPLPGAPDWGGDWSAVELAAGADADALATGGVGALLIENYHDAPYYPGVVPPVTVAAMTALTGAIARRHPDLPLGVNVLRNDAEAALAVAVACGARFVRVNVHAGAAVTDQGLLQGQAHRTVRRRRELGADVAILADVQVKHAAPLAARDIVAEAADLRERGRADALIVTGPATGAEAAPAELQTLRAALPDCPLLVGSGLTADNVGRFAGWSDGFIVASSLAVAAGDGPGSIAAPRVLEFVAALAAARDGREPSSKPTDKE